MPTPNVTGGRSPSSKAKKRSGTGVDGEHVAVEGRHRSHARRGEERTLLLEEAVLGVIVALSSTVVISGVLDPSMLPKLTVTVVGTVGLVSLLVGRAVIERWAVVPWGRRVAPLAGLIGALTIATVTSSDPARSALGVFGRWTGFVPYLAHLVLFAVIVTMGVRAVAPLIWGYLGALGFVVTYAMLQILELDPVAWQDDGLPPVFSVFGNVNFASGWIGAVLPLALWGVIATESAPARAALSFLLAGAVASLVAAGSVQGPVAGGAGMLILSMYWARERGGEEPRGALVRIWVPRLGLLAGFAGVVVIGVLLAVRPDAGARQRVHFWDAALAVFAEHPVLGTGLDTYGDFFLAARSAEGAVEYGFEPNDAPHSVPLGMFSNGGLVLGLAYLAFVVSVAVVLVKGLRRLSGAERVRLAAFGGVWIGYQVQSLVSFDVPPLALLHYGSAAAIVTLAGPPITRVVELPGRREQVRNARRRRAAPVPPSSIIGVGIVGVAAVLLVVVVTRPLRADLAVGSAATLLEQGRGFDALARIDSGIDLAPYEPRYRALRGQLLLAAGDPAEALASFEAAAERDAGSVQYALAAAKVSVALGDPEDGRPWYGEALRRDPHNPAVLVEVAENELARGEAAQALRLLEQAVERRVDVAALVRLGQAAQAVGECQRAVAAFEGALELDAGNDEAIAGLAQLDGGDRC